MAKYGGIAQLARAFGSYPKCRWFKSICRYQWPDGQEVKTPPFHGGITSSILVRVTMENKVIPRLFGGSFLFLGRIAQLVRAFASHARGRGFESPCVHQRQAAAPSSTPHKVRCAFFAPTPTRVSFLPRLPISAVSNLRPQFFILNLDFCGQRVSISLVPHAWLRLDAICAGLFLRNFYCRIQPMVKNYFLASVG